MVNCKLRKKSIKVLQCDTRMLLGVALERWGRKVDAICFYFLVGSDLVAQTQWLAERNGFEMQVVLPA